MSLSGITGFGAYIPRLRIDRSLIADAHAWMAPSLHGGAKGHRAFCSWDEDAVTMAVEAGRDCLGQTDAKSINAITVASTTLPYADLQSSAIVAGALQLRGDVQSLDIANSQRGATSALIQALQSGKSNLLIGSERPVAKPASTQELSHGAGSAALTIGSDNVLAECLSHATVTTNFVDHFRASTERHDYHWEERWVRDEGIMKLVPPAIQAALEKAGVSASELDYLIVPPVQRGIGKALAAKIGLQGQLADELTADCGFTGAAHPLLMLSAVLENAKPGEVLLLLGIGQGVDAIVLKATDRIADYRPRRGVSGSLSDRVQTDSYLRLLSFYDNVDLDWGMRAEASGKTLLSVQYRAMNQTESFMAGRCPDCGTVQFPQLQYCVNTDCAAPAARFENLSLVDQPCKVLTYTSDWLSYYPAPPLYLGFIQFDNGARVFMEIVDIGPEGIEVGTPMRHMFRVKEIDRQRGYRRYFWKATPMRGNEV